MTRRLSAAAVQRIFPHVCPDAGRWITVMKCAVCRWVHEHRHAAHVEAEDVIRNNEEGADDGQGA